MTDYISREAAREKYCDFCIGRDICDHRGRNCNAMTAFDAIPAADVRPVVRATWEKVMEQPYLRKHYHVVACSACHKRGNQGWKYCPNCGADMREEQT